MTVEFEGDEQYKANIIQRVGLNQPTVPDSKKYTLIAVICVCVIGAMYFTWKSQQHPFPSAAEHERNDALHEEGHSH